MSQRLRIIGVDPGLSGALAIYETATRSLIVEDMPVFELKKGKTSKRYIDYAALARLLDAWCAPEAGGDPVVAFLELVSSRPGEGVASAFDFGRSYGAVKMGLHAQFIRVEDVGPTTWKRAIGIPVGAGKDQSRALASNLFPQHAHLFKRVKDDGRAEAALIARYGAAKLSGVAG